ncbi:MULTISPECIES: BCCT family transporter [Planococcus]|uniref:Choline transporter n=1 Tax=Planococcus faecalis TaxID=1598147 RepID=A0ABN4XED7_9BACL|nr:MULTISPECIES: BCCT family transporter [Planococcus]AQU78151.1 choline transporter [Planococcus faecalis]MDJ0331216.1 BCCT family transporter [Planococcus sp. S3-L1]OHX53754.1 choline transporter [Planococcus faecalis]
MKNVTVVFWTSLLICLGLVVWGLSSPDSFKSQTGEWTVAISNTFGWYYLLTVFLILAFCIYLIFSKFSTLKLGKPEDKPEFSLVSWFSMLFSAGMGMGLVFWTTAEPISHAFISAPKSELGSNEAIQEAMQFSFFHWGLHAWAIYGIVALVLAYFKFHNDAPGLISATLIPLFGEKLMAGPLGKMIDVLAVFATVIGVASTLGFGSAQINEGISFLFGTPNTFTFQVLILAVATVLFIASAWSGIGRGIKYLSNINMVLAFVLLLLLLIVGPTLYIFNSFSDAIGGYLTNFFSMSFNLEPVNEERRTWVNAWTVFYWAWWISWAPFVGIFIARISRGRTVKEFMLGVLLVPSLVCFIFFAVFGVSALNLEQNNIAKISEYSLETATFGVLQYYPLGTLLSIITLVVIAIFFITSADSATFVLGMQTTGGMLNPPNLVKITWGLIQSAVAAIVIYTGGTQGLQNALIIAALPFSLVIILMGISFLKAASYDPLVKNKKRQ